MLQSARSLAGLIENHAVPLDENGFVDWIVDAQAADCREWALRQGWGGRLVRQESAQGILVAALGVLAKHYGIRQIEGLQPLASFACAR